MSEPDASEVIQREGSSISSSLLGPSDEMDSNARGTLDAPPENRGYNQFDFSGVEAPRLTHYLFRFPAKFHPPVVHSLVRSYTTKGQTVLDPFCGSGTLPLVAAVEGRHAVGSDVDPLAVFVTEVKTHRFNPQHLQASWNLLHPLLKTSAGLTNQYRENQSTDIPQEEYSSVLLNERLWVPDIPNIVHWFRRYVVLDLARILGAIHDANIPETHRSFFRLVIASIIRKVSNADPVPVSGLEVTAYMKKLELKGRRIDPFESFQRATEKALTAVTAYCEATTPLTRVSVAQADATSLSSTLRKRIDAVITSPPYHNAVDYYRRHKLEMFWLGLTASHADRLELLPRYIGRSRVNRSDALLKRKKDLGLLSTSWEEKIRGVSAVRADAFVHYIVAMKNVFTELAKIMRQGSPVIFVLGHSEWNGSRLPTSDLFVEIAADLFALEEQMLYPIKNRYMSYSRRNGADISQEYVLVFRRR